MKIENRSRKRSHKLAEIGVGIIRTIPFLTIPSKTCFVCTPKSYFDQFFISNSELFSASLAVHTLYMYDGEKTFPQGRGICLLYYRHFLTPIPEHLTHLFSTTLENSVFTYYSSDGNGTTGIEWCINQVCHTLRSKPGGKALIQERTGVRGSNPPFAFCLGIFLVTPLLRWLI